jgi:hypothetical protein
VGLQKIIVLHRTPGMSGTETHLTQTAKAAKEVERRAGKAKTSLTAKRRSSRKTPRTAATKART